MFRLIKLSMYVLFGWMLYELYQGMSQDSQQGGGGRGQSRGLERALNRDSGRMNVTGGGRGESMSSQESDGTSIPHTVGRGVISH
jgi:hypothetical protein